MKVIEMTDGNRKIYRKVNMWKANEKVFYIIGCVILITGIILINVFMG